MSGDPDQAYFSDGISEDIITALSKLRWFFVIARNSSFIYKGKALHIKQVAEELGVGYVVEGSVRKSGDRVRITAQRPQRRVVGRQNDRRRHSYQFLGVGPKPLGVTGSPAVVELDIASLNPP
jgi:TolB-like protein